MSTENAVNTGREGIQLLHDLALKWSLLGKASYLLRRLLEKTIRFTLIFFNYS